MSDNGLLLAIDPGNIESAWVVYDPEDNFQAAEEPK